MKHARVIFVAPIVLGCRFDRMSRQGWWLGVSLGIASLSKQRSFPRPGPPPSRSGATGSQEKRESNCSPLAVFQFRFSIFQFRIWPIGSSDVCAPFIFLEKEAIFPAKQLKGLALASMGLLFQRITYPPEFKTLNLNGFGWVCFFTSMLAAIGSSDGNRMANPTENKGHSGFVPEFLSGR